MKALEAKIPKLSSCHTELDQPYGGGREEAQGLVAGASVVAPP